MSEKPNANFDRVRQALARGQRDSQLLDGRDYDERYWSSARASLSRIQRQLEVVTRERDALLACVDREAARILGEEER